MKFRSVRFSVFALIAAAFLIIGNAFAQEAEDAVKAEVTDQDRIAAAVLTSNVRYHLFLTPEAKAKGISPDSPNVRSIPRITSLPTPPAGTFFYPEEVFKTSTTGKTILTAQNHSIFIDCPTTPVACWGDPNTFLNHLFASNMIHVADQYVGSKANGRYTVGTSVKVSTSIFAGTSGVPTLGENDIIGIVHASASALGGKAATGYGHIYHVFIPMGVDTCMDEGACYSPDNLNTFVFCAYHFTATFSDIGTVYYTVEPYQGPLPSEPASCAIPFKTANNALTDSMATSLLHETFETITDPDIITGYRVLGSLFGGEVADICEGVIFAPTGVPMAGKNYSVQAIYSNTYEACATTP